LGGLQARDGFFKIAPALTGLVLSGARNGCCIKNAKNFRTCHFETLL
jgi:hypothetical protein